MERLLTLASGHGPHDLITSGPHYLTKSATKPHYLNHFDSSHTLSRDGSANGESRNVSRNFRMHGTKGAADQCQSPPSFTPPTTRATCADLRASRFSALRGVRLVMGITSSPDKWGAKRRNGIRETWFRYDMMGQAAIACFVVGRRGVRPRDSMALDREAQRHGDMIFLRATFDGKGPFVTITKLHAWFRIASEMLGLIDRGGGISSASSSSSSADGSSSLAVEDFESLSASEVRRLHPESPRRVLASAELFESVRHVAKVDDDTFIIVPKLLSELDSLHCQRNVYYGNFAFSGYNPITFTKCGFDYGPQGGRYRKYNCSNPEQPHGAPYPPFPWSSGAVMLASTPLIARIAADAAVGSFVARSSDPAQPHQPGMKPGHNTDEDVALGYWLSRFHLSGVARVTYVRVNDKLTNLGCRRNNGLYRTPQQKSVGVHFVKTAGGMQYVWGLVVDGEKPNITKCHRMTGDGRI